MKRLSVNLITFFIICISSGVFCAEEGITTTTTTAKTADIIVTTPKITTKGACIKSEGTCTENDDCCDGICKKSFSWNEGFCYVEEEEPLVFGKNHAICSYHKLDDNLRDMEFKKYGYNAAHPVLGAGNNLRVVYKNIEVPVKINELITKSNDTLELSEEAAKMLGIEREGIYPCDVEVVVFSVNTDYLYHVVLGFVPIAFIFYALYNWLY